MLQRLRGLFTETAFRYVGAKTQLLTKSTIQSLKHTKGLPNLTVLSARQLHLSFHLRTTKDEEYLTALSKQLKPYPIFNDPIHGIIELHPLLVKIINTTQFQRLKDIKQLGICDYVYPGATHTRFEHSLGTSHLCGKLIDTLHELQGEEIDITEEERLCVKIAGLCHDLGQGPFSHFFDEVYLKMVKPELQWKHEKASCLLFGLMLDENPKLRESFRKNGLDEEHESFIKELIEGKQPDDKKEVTRKCKKTGKPKWFLYEIVANKQNGIDCDKFDYFARDCANVGVITTFDHRRYFKNVRIMPVKNQLHICVRDKEVFNLYELFHTRWSFHHRVCQHKTKAPIEHLLAKALQNVDQIMGISEAVNDMKRYTLLTDSILYDILRNESEECAVRKAKELIRRIQERKIYKFCGQTQPPSDAECPIKDKIEKELAEMSEGVIGKEDIFVSIVEFSYGMKEKDPVDAVTFYNKFLEHTQISKKQVSKILPKKFLEKYIRVYAKNPEQRDQVKDLFEDWCFKQGFPKTFGR